ncbi:protein FAM117A isoform X2 [Pleurodeles waltl]|uniref:protein FAM117A isoform X2 n=1 Tax=Pleurodeles waltl TaxID=8319 RepID=UPI0037096754
MASRGGSSVCSGTGLRAQPLRATVPFQLRGAEGARAASVPCSARGDKASFPIKVSRVRRTSSLDTILGSYLQGQWPRDPDGVEPVETNNKSTQTPLSWPETALDGANTGAHKRSASWGNNEYHKDVVKVKQQLQKTKLSQASQANCSPVLGDHTLGVPRDSPPSCPGTSPFIRHRVRRHRSLEDQELEDMFVKEMGEQELLRVLDVPDGHRAPVPQRCCSDLSLLSMEFSGLVFPLSPSAPLRLPPSPTRAGLEGTQNVSLQSLLDPQDKESGWSSPVCAAASSPRPNHSYMFQREPPEGCEKVEAYEETLSPGLDPSLMLYGPDKNKVHFNPTGSAFCPINLAKPLLPNVDFLLRNFPAPGISGTGQARGQSPYVDSIHDPDSDAFGEVSAHRWSPSHAAEGSAFHSSLVV